MSLANLAHLHLLLNHFPTVGFAVTLGLLIVGTIVKNEGLKRAGLVILYGLALTIPVYMTGKAAERLVLARFDVAETLIETHQDRAFLAFIFMQITGGIAWLGLWQFRRTSRRASWNLPAVLIFSLVTFGLMVRAANLGGEIRHPEIVAEGTVASGPAWLSTASIADLINTRRWIWPALETLHFIGLGLLLGAVLVINLRMLGVAKTVSFASLHRLLPWGILGFGINLVTGMLFFISLPGQYIENISMHYKMVLMLIAAVNVLYFTLFEEAWALRSGDDASMTAKVISGATIFLWIGVIYFGRMLPYIGGAYRAWL